MADHETKKQHVNVDVKDTASTTTSSSSSDISKLPEDHPVHKIPPEKQEKMRKKGVNPVLKAEMDEATGKGFWSKYSKTSMGPWMV